MTPDELKAAYRAALLRHHPDKHSPTAQRADRAATIDAIKLAYTTLSHPALRAAYDKSLLTTPSAQAKNHHTGEESLDLDDLPFDEASGEWYRVCRCGEERGFVVTEAELEEEMARGGREVVVGCRGCSLWVRVGFGVVEEDEGLKDGEENRRTK
jgi:diphthamide biosynthesis protein 4